jgi:aerobic carbon-monoxide dehydrogenase large subunit
VAAGTPGTAPSPAGGNTSAFGAALLRLEDRRFLTGRGRYVDDIHPPGTAHAVLVRAEHAHALIRSINTTEALAAPGVLAVLSAADLAADGLGELPCMAFPPQPGKKAPFQPGQPLLATGRVRHVGEAIALVVAETAALARDAAERVAVTFDPLPATTLEDADRPDAPRVWDEAGSNRAFGLERGDAAAVEAAFARAAHVTRLTVHHPRAVANAIEPRAVLASRDDIDGRWVLYSSTQIPWQVREIIAQVLGLPETDLRVVAPDVGGGFGMKAQIYPEEALVLWAARRLGRPVKWRAERGESLACDQHGRHQVARGELALDAAGRALALRVSVAIDLGAYLCNAAGVPPLNAAISYTSTYDIPHIHAVVDALYTHTAPVGPYRGSGKPEASFLTERLFDAAAREMGIDGIALRRRNLIPASAMPYRTPGGYVFDSGDFPRVLEASLELADWAGFAGRRRESEARGRLRGIGLAMHCQRAGSLSERMEIRFTASGSVAVHLATLSTGQGHETAFAQMLSGWLGIPLERIRLFQGDTDRTLYGRGTFAQRSMIAGGSALRLAADQVIAKGRALAAWMLEAAEADVAFEAGRFRVGGTDRAVSLEAVARRAFAAPGLPPQFGIGLEGAGTHPGPNTFPNGAMVCEVEVDPDTGRVRVLTLAAVDDVGAVINPITLEGQLHGSVAQGLGPALFEQMLYERTSGQLLTGSFQDYAMPRADDMPAMRSALCLVPTTSNPLGVKGGSEAGNVGATAAIHNALMDALAPFGVQAVPLPATPEAVWRAIRAARG